ncbi:hypothetical protein BCR32DRAFT_329886 [Anaeromyces robustus]|uniref:Uncharacterized protein n=1 Tax=Anaeromyces robustus TaxID=1754192 RepID=A0A1Y1WPN8_9FUNG|nr:hypothetical protein BCR32DRAFT_329886 [Anaeromyces robustus]|eukprot:ORX75258.1 hypothetical protein BCR32DRAFT_329886 [Anaeromyces robustus]
MNMKVLYMTAADQNTIVPSMFEAYGMVYDTVTLPVTQTVNLETNGKALYSAIVIENATQDIITTIKPFIEELQKKYKIRVAYLNCEPDQSFGITAKQSVFMRKVLLTKQGIELAKKYQMKGEGMHMDVGTCIVDSNFNCQPYNHYEVTFNNPDYIPILKYDDIDDYAGVVVKQKDGLESIHIFIPFIESTSAYFTSHLWISWVNYGLINGFRRIYFDIQVDDYFADNKFNYTEGIHYRTSVDDMKNISNWQKDILKRMPNGSDFKLELAMNGLHVLTNAHHKEFVAADWTVYDVGQDYVKPLTEVGSNRWQGNEDTEWDPMALKEDPLYAYFAENPQAQDDFYWLTHTFSHQNLNFASLHDADMEIGLNVKMADEPYLGMYKRDCFSQHSIVTPEISGLHNGHVLQVFEKYGIKYAVGDTSRKDLTQENYHLPFISTMETSNYEGFIVIPRQPPQIYWDCSTKDEILAYYQQFYGNTIEWTTHLKNEAELHVKNLLKLRHDPYMFHEGNLRNVDMPEIEMEGVTGRFGLLQQWVERILAEYNKYLDWPLISIKMDNLAETYLRRLKQKQCQPQYTMIIDEKSLKISEIKVSSTSGECRVPLFAIRDAEFDTNGITVEKIGNDPPTAWIDINSGAPKSIKFKNDVIWNDDTYTGSTSSGNTKNLFNNNKNGENQGTSKGINVYVTVGSAILAVLFISLALYYFCNKRKRDTRDDSWDNLA